MTAKDNVVGKYAKADLAVGDYILAAKLSDVVTISLVMSSPA